MSESAGASLLSGAECALCGRGIATAGLCAECARGLPPTRFKPLSRAAVPLGEGEVVLYQTRRKDLRNPRSLLVPPALFVLAFFVMFAGQVLLWPGSDTPMYGDILLGTMLLVNFLYLLDWWRQRCRRITVTNRRTIYEQGFFRGNVTEFAYQLEMTAMMEPAASGCPTLVIDTGSRGHIIPDLRCAARVCRLINALVTETVPAPIPARASAGPPPPPLPPRPTRL